MNYTLKLLYSGSDGNAAVLQTQDCAVLIDAGRSARHLCTTLRNAGVEPEQLCAVFLTHGVEPCRHDFRIVPHKNISGLEVPENIPENGVGYFAGPAVIDEQSAG